MPTCNQNDLAAALRHCNPCPAAPPSRNFILADRIDPTRCKPNQQVLVKLDGIDCVDSKGRQAHVRGIFWAAKAVVNLTVTEGQPTTDKVPAYDCRSIWGNIHLQATEGEEWLSALQGPDLLDDTFMRHWSQQNAIQLQAGVQGLPGPNITMNAGIPSVSSNQTVTVDVGMYYPLVTYGGSPFEGLIPLARLQRGGYQSLRFKVENDFWNISPAPGQAPRAPQGVEFDHLVRYDGDDGMDIWLDVVYLPVFVVDAHWQLDSYPLPEQQAVLKWPDRTTEHLSIRFHSDDNSENTNNLYGQDLCQSQHEVTLNVGGWAVMDGLDDSDATVRSGMFYALEPHGAQARNNAAQDLPMFDGGNFLDFTSSKVMVLLPIRQRETAAAGPVKYKFSSRNGSFTRFLHRVVACHTVARAQAIAKKLGCSPCQAIIPVQGKNGTPVDQPLSTSPVLVVPNSNSATMLKRGLLEKGPY